MTHIVVLGTPQPGGSKRAFRSGNRVLVTDSNPRAAQWKRAVAEAAIESGAVMEDGPVSVRMVFYVARPKSHYGTGRNSERIRPGAPQFPESRPDVLKLARPVEDALTGIAYRDDSQTVSLTLEKRYGTPERVEIWISPAPKE